MATSNQLIMIPANRSKQSNLPIKAIKSNNKHKAMTFFPADLFTIKLNLRNDNLNLIDWQNKTCFQITFICRIKLMEMQ